MDTKSAQKEVPPQQRVTRSASADIVALLLILDDVDSGGGGAAKNKKTRNGQENERSCRKKEAGVKDTKNWRAIWNGGGSGKWWW